MHVAVDLNWLLQLIVLALAAAFGFLYLVRNTASRFFVVDSNFSSSTAEFSLHRKNTGRMGAEVTGTAEVSDSCAVCGLLTKKHCSRCKMVKYCSESCQRSHWNSEHKTKCKDLQSFYEANHTKSKSGSGVRKSSLVGAGGSSKIMKQSNKILFPYEEFVKIFNWDKPGYTPCGLLNCGNSCFANAVLQCLGYTRPLVAYLLEKGHKIECQMDDWCFLCEFQTHLERANQSVTPFSPINILSRLPNIGGNLGYGKQEDAHEFMRFAIDTMQSVCLDEFGGEKNVHPSYQETTLIQHIFGGCLLSQVICTECNNVSNQFENMMDLTVEIHGDAGSLEECLDQFTAKEWLHGDNMYKCDGCNAYVMAWKRLAVQRAPNILTIALKRFQSGRFGKLNKRITFPDTLDLSPYMSGLEDGNDVYKLYAVIVHVDMLNASYFGHYICYVKDFCGNWYRIDDCKVATVDLDEVLSQGAYMLLYSRICARRSCFLSEELLKKQENENMKIRVVDPSLKQPTECLSAAGCLNSPVDSGDLTSANCSGAEVNHDENLLSTINAEDAKRGDADMVSWEASFPVFNVEPRDSEGLLVVPEEVASPMKCTNQPHPASTSFTDEGSMQAGGFNFEPFPISDVENESQGDKGDADEGLLMFENDDKCDISPITICKVQEEEPVYSTSMTENANCGGNGSVSPDDDTKGAAKKLNIESSGAKLKSVLAPGFLGNYPRKVLIKQEDKVLTDLREGSPQFHLNNKTNEVVRPYLLPENGCLLKDEKKPRSVLENGQVSMKSVGDTILENGYPLKDDKISSLVLENEQVSMKSFGHKILENGDTGHWTAL